MDDPLTFLDSYLAHAPIPLALIRAIDCRHMAKVPWKGKILDIGCGDGLFAQILFAGKKGFIDTGIDFNDKEIQKASQTGIYKNLFAADVTQLKFPDQTFDMILCNSVLEHIPQLDKALMEMSRVLKKEGTLVITVPSEYLSEQLLFPRIFKKLGLKSLARWYVTTKNKVWHHYHLYAPEVWKNHFQRAHLEMVQTKYIHPQSVTQLCDLFTFSGALSLLWRKCFGRLLLFPGKWRAALLTPRLKKHYLADQEIGSTILFIVKKV